MKKTSKTSKADKPRTSAESHRNSHRADEDANDMPTSAMSSSKPQLLEEERRLGVIPHIDECLRSCATSGIAISFSTKRTIDDLVFLLVNEGNWGLLHSLCSKLVDVAIAITDVAVKHRRDATAKLARSAKRMFGQVTGECNYAARTIVNKGIDNLNEAAASAYDEGLTNALKQWKPKKSKTQVPRKVYEAGCRVYKSVFKRDKITRRRGDQDRMAFYNKIRDAKTGDEGECWEWVKMYGDDPQDASIKLFDSLSHKRK